MKKIALILAVITMLATLFACAPDVGVIGGADGPTSIIVSESGEADGSLDYIMDKGNVIMGLDDSFPPMGFRDEGGELVGFDIDLAAAIFENMGVELVLQPIDWSAKEMELNAKNIDVIWNGFTITEERKENLLMSPAYMQNAQIVIVPVDSDIQTLDDLKGKDVAVQNGSSAQVALEDSGLASEINQVDFAENVTAMMDVSIGATDALAVDIVVAEYYMSQDPGKFRILEETLAPEEYGIGFRKGEYAFHNAVMASYAELKESGKLAEISEKWFGRDVTY